MIKVGSFIITRATRVKSRNKKRKSYRMHEAQKWIAIVKNNQ